jgi:tRNA1Val (adenine37-N6)-methyltransferase
MQSAWRLLKDDGELSVVVPFDYRQRMEDEATFVGFFPSRVCAIKTVVRKPVRRFLLSFRKHPCERVLETMTMGDDYYQQLTKDFYL